MGVETSAVEIRIDVTDANSAAAIAGVEGNLNKLGAAGAGAGAKTKSGLDQVGAAALSSHEKVRLLSEEFGIRIPRAMQSVISNCPAVMGAINGLGTAMIGLGAIQIGGMVFSALISGAEKAWDKITGLSKATQDYLDETAKTKSEDFGNTHSIETTRARIDEATEAVRRYTDEARNANKTVGWRNLPDLLIPGAGGMWQTSHARGEAQRQQFEAQKNLDKLQHLREAEQAHEQRESDIDLKYAGNVGLKGKARHDAEVQEAIERAHEERFYGTEQDNLSNSVPANAGADKEAREVLLARKKADAELASEEKQHGGDEKSRQAELARIHREALESGLRGSALYHQQEADAIEDLKRRGIASAQAVEDIHTRFHNAEMQRLQEESEREERKLQEMRGETSLLGLSGVARIRQEAQNRINELVATPGGDPGQRLAQINEINKQTALRTDEQIKSDAQKAQEAADRDMERRRHAAEETERIEAQARVHSLSDEKQKTASIQAEYEERFQKYREELLQEEISQEDFNRRVAAAAQERDAQMVQASAEARKKMAGEFEGFFKGMDHPGQYFKEQGDKVAGQFAATLFQRFQRHGQGNESTAQGGLFGGLLAHVGGIPRHGENPVQSTHTVAQSSFSVAAATIYIGSATLAGGAASSTAGGAAWSGRTGGSDAGSYGSTGGAGVLQSAQNAYSQYKGGGGGMPGGGGSEAGSFGRTGGAGVLQSAQRVQNAYSQYKGGGGGMPSGGGFSFGNGSGGGTGEAPATSDGQGVQLQQLNPGTSWNSGSSGSGAGGPMGMGGSYMGAVQGAEGLWAAHESGGGVSGAMHGAEAGAQAGEMFGPIGMAVGAVAGAIIGFIGSKEQARVYDLQVVRPRLDNDQKSYEQGSMNYLSAYQDMESLRMESFKTTDKMGHSGRTYRNEFIIPEIKKAEGRLDAQEKAGRSQYSASAASYATGTPYVDRTGYNLNHAGERIFSAPDNRQITKAITEGNRGTMPAQAAWSGDVHVHLNALDAKTGTQFLMANMHTVRAAFNESLGENSGGGMN
jgi:hypothetical protein